MNLGRLLFVFLQLFVLFLINKAGFFLVKIAHLPIPGNVMGMIILFLLLSSGVIRLQWVDDVSSFLIKHLSFFFIPVSVGLMTLVPVFIKSGVPLLVVLIISTLAGIVVSGSLSQALVTRKEVIQNEHRHHNV